MTRSKEDSNQDPIEDEWALVQKMKKENFVSLTATQEPHDSFLLSSVFCLYVFL